MKALYAYFGLIDLHTIDSPGHSLYQLGLIDSIRVSYGVEKFDFYSYYPEELQAGEIPKGIQFPDTDLGKVFAKYRTDVFDEYGLYLSTVLDNIRTKKYSQLYLKARFRNISTLTKKWKDAHDFEEIIDTAVASGYTKENIIILDTDLSLPTSFYKIYGDVVTISIPSIDFPGISNRFLLECVAVHKENYTKEKASVFYGNIDTSNYKSGNSKSSILMDVLGLLSTTSIRNPNVVKLILIGKQKDLENLQPNILLTYRNMRQAVWSTLEKYLVMINVTKEKYDERRFIPARIYEAMIFGMIPVSYKFSFLSETFSFNTPDDLREIIIYLNECDQDDLKKAYLTFINSYLNYCENTYD